MTTSINESSARKIQMPRVVPGPWTLAARQRTIDKECQQHFVDYFGKAMHTRRWSPWHDLPFAEMKEHGSRLSPETINLIEGFLGIEEYVGDYVLDGLEMFRNSRTRRNLQLQWGSEELKHGVSWEMVLLHSGARTEEQIETYCRRVQEHRWSHKNHAGADDPLGVTIYAMVQERATFFNYQEVKARIRQEYGLPKNPTPEERERGYEVGAAEAFRVVGVDEIAHHGIFLQIVLTHLKYLPEKTLDLMEKVFRGFQMPSLRLIPNARDFIRAVAKTRLHTAERHLKFIHNPILKSLGLEDNEAFNRAVQAVKLLPAGLGPDQVKLGRNGEFVIGYA
ncbi:MAG TPA: acyl-ACP desaturase [Anaerolineae bacterium]|nr:acyl-ACP desaturase [Anaerolineae bacterium]